MRRFYFVAVAFGALAACISNESLDPSLVVGAGTPDSGTKDSSTADGAASDAAASFCGTVTATVCADFESVAWQDVLSIAEVSPPGPTPTLVDAPGHTKVLAATIEASLDAAIGSYIARRNHLDPSPGWSSPPARRIQVKVNLRRTATEANVGLFDWDGVGNGVVGRSLNVVCDTPAAPCKVHLLSAVSNNADFPDTGLVIQREVWTTVTIDIPATDGHGPAPFTVTVQQEGREEASATLSSNIFGPQPGMLRIDVGLSHGGGPTGAWEVWFDDFNAKY